MKRILAFLMTSLMLMGLCVSANATTVMIADDWVLETTDGSEWVIDSYIGEDEDVSLITEYGTLSFYILDDHAFANNETIRNISIPEGIEEIGDYVFLNASSLYSVSLSATVTKIGIGAFSGTGELKAIDLESTGITEVCAYTFLNSGIEEVALPETCEKIANNAFAQCDNLLRVTIPASVTEIGEDAFRSADQVVINAPYGSYAIEYAKANGIKYSYSDITEVTFLRGDADGDGEITIIDATKIQRVRALYENDSDGMIALRAKSGVEPELSIMDATRIQRKIALYNDPYGIGESVTVLIMSDGTIFNPVEEA